MANSTTITLTGKSYWARVFKDNVDWGYEDEHKDTGGVYTINLELDEDNQDKLRLSNSQSYDYAKEIEVDGELRKLFKFKRFNEKRNRAGELLEWASGQPAVFGPDDSEWDVEADGFIGNGSEVEVKLTVYKAGRVYGTRIESIKVINHVPQVERV